MPIASGISVIWFSERSSLGLEPRSSTERFSKLPIASGISVISLIPSESIERFSKLPIASGISVIWLELRLSIERFSKSPIASGISVIWLELRESVERFSKLPIASGISVRSVRIKMSSSSCVICVTTSGMRPNGLPLISNFRSLDKAHSSIGNVCKWFPETF